MSGEASLQPAAVMGTPESAYQEIDAVSERAGGAWELPLGYEGSVGRTMFDTPASHDGTLTVLLPKENIDRPNRCAGSYREFDGQAHLFGRRG